MEQEPTYNGKGPSQDYVHEGGIIEGDNPCFPFPNWKRYLNSKLTAAVFE